MSNAASSRRRRPSSEHRRLQPAPREAMGMVLAGLSYLAAADPTALAAQAQAECLQAFEQAAAISTAARAWFLGAFTSGQGYCQDADYSPDRVADPPDQGDQGRGAGPAGLVPPGHGPPAGRRWRWPRAPR